MLAPVEYFPSLIKIIAYKLMDIKQLQKIISQLNVVAWFYLVETFCNSLMTRGGTP